MLLESEIASKLLNTTIVSSASHVEGFSPLRLGVTSTWRCTRGIIKYFIRLFHVCTIWNLRNKSQFHLWITAKVHKTIKLCMQNIYTRRLSEYRRVKNYHHYSDVIKKTQKNCGLIIYLQKLFCKQSYKAIFYNKIFILHRKFLYFFYNNSFDTV